MSNNTRSNPALAPRRGIFQAMPPAANLEIGIPSTIQQRPEATNTYTSLHTASNPLFSSPYEDLLNQWIVFPDEDQPQEPALKKHDLHEIPIANNDDNSQITALPDGPFPPAAGGNQFDADALLRLGGIASDPENQVTSLNPEPALDWNDYLKLNDELYADVAAMMVVNPSTQPQNEEEISDVGNVVSSNVLQETLDVCSQPLGDSTSQSAATTAHTTEIAIATPVSGLSPGSATTTIRSQSTTTNNSQPSEMEIPSRPTASLSNGSTEHLGSGSVINIFNGNNTVNMSYYQTPSWQANPPQQPQPHDQTGTTPVATAPTVVPSPPPSSPSIPFQSHLPPQARPPVPLPDLIARPRSGRGQRSLPNSSFRPTPLKQSWTSADLTVKGNQTVDIPSRPPVQSESAAPNLLAMTQAIAGPMEAYASAQPQAPAQTALKYHQQNHIVPTQQPPSYSQLDANSSVPSTWTQPVQSVQVNSAVQVDSSTRSRGLTPALTQSSTPAPQDFRTTPTQQTQSHTSIPDSYLVKASDFDPSRNSTKVTSALFTTTTSGSPSSTTQLSMYPTFPPQTTIEPTQLGRTSVEPYEPVGAQEPTQAQQDVEVLTYMVRADGGGWLLVRVINNRPVLVYPCIPRDPRVVLPPSHDHTVGDGSHPPPPSAPEPVYQHAPVQPAPQQINQTVQPVEAYAAPTNPQPEIHPPQANGHEHIHQSLPPPVQRTYSAPSLPVQAPEGLFTPSAPTSSGFKPRGDDTFSLAYWQHAPLDPGPSRSPNVRSFAPAPIYGYTPPSHAPAPAAYTRASTSAPGPLAWSHVPAPAPAPVYAHAHAATPLASQSSSSLSSLSVSTSSSSNSPAASPAPPAPKNKGKKRCVSVKVDDEIQEIPSSEYHASRSKGKRVKRGGN